MFIGLMAAFWACPRIAAQAYFPPGILAEKPEAKQFTERWYSGQLRGLHEPSLWELSKTQKSETYRFLWLRSFNPPISVRLSVNTDGTSSVTIKECALGRDAFDTGKLLMNQHRVLSKPMTDYFLNEVTELEFWKMPTREKTDQIGVDGAEWILEGVKHGKYLVVDRWSPKEGTVRVLGIHMLIDIAKLKLLYQEVY